MEQPIVTERTTSMPNTRTADILRRPMGRRGLLAMVATALVGAGAAQRAAASEETSCPPCGANEICLAGICSVIVTDGCEAFGCNDGLQCIEGRCESSAGPTGKTSRRKRKRKGRGRRRGA
jgi:hypothetical protein